MASRKHPALTIEKFELGEIDGDSFDHEAHVHIAWLYLNEYAVTEAIERFTLALRRLTTKLGVPGKYHDTISWFFMLIIAERRDEQARQCWSEFKADNSDLLQRENNILYRYYSKEILASDGARRSFVLPDKLVA